MLMRLYIDNFRCFDAFEYLPAKRQLIIGRNGSGKSSLFDALSFVRQFVCVGSRFSNLFPLSEKTLWLNRPQQKFEVRASVNGINYQYALLLDLYNPPSEPPLPRVVTETVYADGKPLFEFNRGEVHLYNDRSEHKVTYPFDWHRSALATVQARNENRSLMRFRD